MTRVWFIVPVFGREELTRVCLRQLARTCAGAAEHGVDATAVVIGDDSSVDLAEDLGFATVRRDNKHLGRKFNDGYQLACDPAYNPAPADYCVPCGSDDWVDPVIFQRLPGEAIGVFRQIAVVNEDRTELMRLRVGYKGGAGIRIIPRWLLERCGYRPADEDRKRAIDTSTLDGMYRTLGRRMPAMIDLDVHALQIVDWKSRGQQLNTYSMLRGYRRGAESEVWSAVGEWFPAEAVEEMRELSLVAV